MKRKEEEFTLTAYFLKGIAFHLTEGALLERQGSYGILLGLEECYERADWQGMQEACRQLNLSVDDVMPRISEAQRWSQDINRLV